MPLAQVEAFLHARYIGAREAALRVEEQKKARELSGMLVEVAQALTMGSRARSRPLRLVDAAAGKGYVGLAAAELLFAPIGQRAEIVAIDRNAAMGDAALPAARAVGQAAGEAVGQAAASAVSFSYRNGDVADLSLWPEAPDLVVALHACGKATDAIIDATIARAARRLLLVPCCVGEGVPTAAAVTVAAERLGIPRHAEVRRRFCESLIASERTLRLEAAGYQVEVVAFVPPTVTPYNLCWRGRRVREPGRMAAAEAALARLRAAWAP